MLSISFVVSTSFLCSLKAAFVLLVVAGDKTLQDSLRDGRSSIYSLAQAPRYCYENLQVEIAITHVPIYEERGMIYNLLIHSFLRNETIARVLYLCKDVETFGSEIRKIYSLCNAEGIEINGTASAVTWSFQSGIFKKA